MSLKRPGAAPYGRAGRPPERGEVHPLQPHHRIPAGPSSRRWPGRPGTPIAQPAEWQGNHFSLVDTGRDVRRAAPTRSTNWWSSTAAKPLRTADLVVFVVDGREGLVPGDEEIAGRAAVGQRARSSSRSTRPTTAARRGGRVEFYSLGFEPIVEIAAEHGQGVGDLLDEIVARFPEGTSEAPAPVKDARDPGRHRRAARTSASRRCSIGC